MTTTRLDPSAELFLANVERIQERVSTANRQLSSGHKISAASDAPDQISSLLQLRAAESLNTQIKSNLEVAKAEYEVSDTALSSSISLMDEALTLALKGLRTNASAADRLGLATEVQSVQQQMVNFCDAQLQGRYVFGGDSAGTPPYTFDTSSTNNAVLQNTTAQSTTKVQDPAGVAFIASKTAQEIFDARNPDNTPASHNVFAALNNLRLALVNNDTTALAAAVDPLKQAGAHLNGIQSFYGSVGNRVEAATDFATTFDTKLRAQISDLEDADATAAALELTSANTQLQAAFQMRAMLPHTSLFDYLG